MPALRLPRTPVRPAGSKPKSSNRGVAAFAALVGCGFFSIPFLAHGLKKENFNSQEKPLNVSAVRRGAYQNSGSRDVGVDKDWDFSTYTWHGRKGADVQRERALKEYERERQQRDGEKSTTN